MVRKPGIGDLRKRWRERLNLWLGSGLVLLLADEYIKEGYLFDPHDVAVPGTHESIITVVIILLIINNVVKRNEENEERDGPEVR